MSEQTRIVELAQLARELSALLRALDHHIAGIVDRMAQLECAGLVVADQAKPALPWAGAGRVDEHAQLAGRLVQLASDVQTITINLRTAHAAIGHAVT